MAGNNGNDCGCVNQSTLVNSAIEVCKNALACCSQGVSSVESNNLCRGKNEIKDALTTCQRALNQIKNVLGCDATTEEQKAIRKCSEGLCDIRRGCSAIASLDIGCGAGDCTAGIEECLKALQILSDSINSDTESDCVCP